MKTNWVRRAAFAVRAPNWIVIDLACQRWRSRIFLVSEDVHAWIAQDLDEEPRMMEADVPPDPDDWIARLARQLQHSQPPAQPQDELHAGPTMPEQPAQHPANEPTIATPRSFWSYAEPAMK